MQTVYLNGGISKFGEKWETACRTIPDIFKLIDCQTPGFRQYLIEAADAGVESNDVVATFGHVFVKFTKVFAKCCNSCILVNVTFVKHNF